MSRRRAFTLIELLVVIAIIAVLIALFVLQRHGTGRVGGLFGPIIILWFGTIGLVGPNSFTQILPEVPIPSLPFVGAYGIKVRSLSAIEDMVQRAGVRTRRSDHGLFAVWPEELGHGAWIFEE